jgi:hypothetical protein
MSVFDIGFCIVAFQFLLFFLFHRLTIVPIQRNVDTAIQTLKQVRKLIMQQRDQLSDFLGEPLSQGGSYGFDQDRVRTLDQEGNLTIEDIFPSDYDREQPGWNDIDELKKRANASKLDAQNQVHP